MIESRSIPGARTGLRAQRAKWCESPFLSDGNVPYHDYGTSDMTVFLKTDSNCALNVGEIYCKLNLKRFI